MNLALDKPIYSNFSADTMDTLITRRSAKRCPQTVPEDGDMKEQETKNLYNGDLKRAVDINRVDLYPVTSGDEERNGQYFPRKFTILYQPTEKITKKSCLIPGKREKS